ncbi:MAG: hypothetical protein ABIH03_14795, partial [Pseudomonadota bacterium]
AEPSARDGAEMARFNDCEMIAGSLIRIADVEATLGLAPEIMRLRKLKPLRFPVEVCVLRRDLAGFYLPKSNDRVRRIVLLSANFRRLRYEWQHALQESQGRSMWTDEAEAEAKAAEGE